MTKDQCHGKSSSKRKKNLKVPILKPPMKSRRHARRITSQFHKLTALLDDIKSNGEMNASNKEMRIKEIEREIESIGGREAYQDASILSTKLFKSSKWIFQQLTSLSLRPSKGQKPLKVLEVGAINTHLINCPWLNVTAIDLNSRDEKIIQCDFFTLDAKQEYEVLVSSMVINCVPQPDQRWRMINLYNKHLKEGGHLFIMLPLLCLSNSKYMTEPYFIEMMESIGFRIREKKHTPKIAFFCFQKIETSIKNLNFSKQKYLSLPTPAFRIGKKRNNFGICINST